MYDRYGQTISTAAPNENDTFMKYSLLDLIGIIDSYADEKNITLVYELAIKGINVRILRD